MSGFLDPETTGPDFITVNGWAFSAVAPIARVEAFIDRLFLGKLQLRNCSRRRTAAVPAHHVACGFSGTLFLTELRLSGEKELKVRVQDEKGNAATYTRKVRLQPARYSKVYLNFRRGIRLFRSYRGHGLGYSTAAP